MKKAIIIAVSIIASVSSIHAAAITFGAVPTAQQFLDRDGVALAGGLVLVGTFSDAASISLKPGSVDSSFSNIASTAGWTQFSQLGIATNTAGRVGGQVIDNTSAADFFNGKPLFLWVFNGTTRANSTQFGIFRAGSAPVPWVFPTNAGGVGDSLTLSTTATGAGTISALGGVGSSGSGLRLVAPVPEPGTVALLLVGAVGFASRRRRA